jgi:hypothetical protein
MFSGPEDEELKEANERASFYTERYDTLYVVYGAQGVNGYVGRTSWLTIAPESDLEAYGLPANPVKSSMLLRDSLKVGGGALAGLTALGCTGHMVYWLYKRKQEVAKAQGALDDYEEPTLEESGQDKLAKQDKLASNKKEGADGDE